MGNENDLRSEFMAQVTNTEYRKPQKGYSVILNYLKKKEFRGYKLQV